MESFRKFYPDASLFVVNDGGYDYTDYCKRAGAVYSYVAKESNMGKPLAYTSKEAVLAYLKRLWDIFPRMKESHFILLEDDVRILRRHTLPFRHTVNGCNRAVRLPDCMLRMLRARSGGYVGPEYYGGCGGCVLDKTFFERIPFADVERLLTETGLTEFHTDQLFSYIALYFGGTVGDYDEFDERFYSDIVMRLVTDRVAFLHQYKFDYGVPPTAEQNARLGSYGAEKDPVKSFALETVLK